MPLATIVVILACVAGMPGTSSARRAAPGGVRRTPRASVGLPGDLEYEVHDGSPTAAQETPGAAQVPAAVTPTQSPTAGNGRVVVTAVLDSFGLAGEER